MTLIGDARVSTDAQNLAAQHDAARTNEMRSWYA